MDTLSDIKKSYNLGHLEHITSGELLGGLRNERVLSTIVTIDLGVKIYWQDNYKGDDRLIRYLRRAKGVRRTYITDVINHGIYGLDIPFSTSFAAVLFRPINTGAVLDISFTDDFVMGHKYLIKKAAETGRYDLQHLSQHIQIPYRTFSGHYCPVNQKKIDTAYHAILSVERYEGAEIQLLDDDIFPIEALHAHGILPVTQEGFPIPSQLFP